MCQVRIGYSVINNLMNSLITKNVTCTCTCIVMATCAHGFIQDIWFIIGDFLKLYNIINKGIQFQLMLCCYSNGD